MPDIGTLQEHNEDLQLELAHTRRALETLAHFIANTSSDLDPNQIISDAMYAAKLIVTQERQAAFMQRIIEDIQNVK